jgi:hypothetical protein
MSNEWYYTRQKKQCGPVSDADLRKLATKGELAPTDKVWKKGMEKWVAADTIKGLFGGGSGDRPAAKSGTTTKKPARPPAEGDKDALDFSEDDDEVVKKPEPKKGGIPVWVWIVGGVFALMFVCCGVGGVGYAVVGGGLGSLFGGGLDNLEKVHKGQSLAEVEALIGKGEVLSTQKQGKKEVKQVQWKGKRHGFDVKIQLPFEDDKLMADPLIF